MAKRKRSHTSPTDRLRLFQVFRLDDGTHEVLLESQATSSEGVTFVREVYAKNFLAAHVAVVGELPQLDEPIKPLVLLLTELGYWTLFCCSGHVTELEDGQRGYIMLYVEQVETLRSLKRLLSDILLDELAEEGPCDCEGPCHGCGHPALRFLRDGTQVPFPNMDIRLELPIGGAPCGEWGVQLGFMNQRPLSPLDYAWLVEQIELRTGRAKPLPPSAPSAPRKSPLTLMNLGGRR